MRIASPTLILFSNCTNKNILLADAIDLFSDLWLDRNGCDRPFIRRPDAGRRDDTGSEKTMYQCGYCGYNVHNPERDNICRPEGSGDYLFVLVTCKMRFFFDKETLRHYPASDVGDGFVRASPGSCILFTPGFPQHYEALSGFTNSFVHFTCAENEQDDYQGPRNHLFYPDNVELQQELLHRIQREYYQELPHREETLHHLIRLLLISVERGAKKEDAPDTTSDLYTHISNIRLHLLSDCEREWNIDAICEMAKIGKSQFYAYYREFFHTSPREEILQARIDRAKFLLRTHDMHIDEVAERCGFHNTPYFIRYFKKICGTTPGQYAKDAQHEALRADAPAGKEKNLRAATRLYK